MSYNLLLKRIADKTSVVGVIGMGYVGLPLALAFADKGFDVVGFDIDNKKIELLKSGKSYIKNISKDRIKSSLKGKCFSPCEDFNKLEETDIIIICVPTPLGEDRDPDLRFVENTTKDVAGCLRKGQLIILESTTYPGCTRNIVKPILEKTGLVVGSDFYLAYSPEREDPGNPIYSTVNIPKVVGGNEPESLNLALTLYKSVVKDVVAVKSMDIAEAVKLTENIFRAVNIALVNELKVIYGKLEVDIWDVIEAAKTKPFGYMPFYPGPGLGGHCIPIDPFYLAWRAKQVGIETRFIELAGEINTEMPEKVVESVELVLNDKSKKTIDEATILLIGVSYKKNVDDIRESPALVIINRLEQKGAKVEFYDPYIPKIPPTRNYSHLSGKESIDWDCGLLSSFDVVVICADHDQINYQELTEHSKVIIDTRNATAKINEGRSKIIKA